MAKNDLLDSIHGHLTFLYGHTQAELCFAQLQELLNTFQHTYPQIAEQAASSSIANRFSEDDVVLITYGDQVREPGRMPLQTLVDALATALSEVVSTVHLLPFYPYSSDDGFAVIDYTSVDAHLGTWADIERLRADYRLMFDAVINHISAESEWFQAFLRGNPGADQRFILMDPNTDLSQVTRPRTTPLLTRFVTPHGPREVWTTFSADQIDLNFANPNLLLEVVQVLLEYVAHGAALLRLDAIGYLWKEVGTSCIHLPQTHRIVQLIRSILDLVAPYVLLVTETNVPHQDNISYFGDGTNEAQMVYQFPLAPLVLNAFASGNARHLSDWSAGLSLPSYHTTFFNFLASHDGIGVIPATRILSPDEINELVERTLAHGGYVSYKTNPDGTQSAYELNITLFDALSNPADTSESDTRKVDRFLAANAIMLALQGVPGIYVHSLIGSHNDHNGVNATGRFRSINREKWERASIEQRLSDPGDTASAVFARFTTLIRARRGERAFHPNGAQRVLECDSALFAILRSSTDGNEHVLCIHNVSAHTHSFHLRAADLPEIANKPLTDLVSGQMTVQIGATDVELTIAPYQVLWLR